MLCREENLPHTGFWEVQSKTDRFKATNDGSPIGILNETSFRLTRKALDNLRCSLISNFVAIVYLVMRRRFYIEPDDPLGRPLSTLQKHAHAIYRDF